MKTIEDSVVKAMDGTDQKLFPFLPYIMQDIWEFGTAPEAIIKLVKKHLNKHDELNILDLGCGKGAVSVKLARALGCKCHGIDAVAEFITVANEKATEYGVGHLCTFETGDIRKKIKFLPKYDAIILGAIGPVLGDYYTTITKLSGCINENGILLIDDAYIDDDSNYTHPQTYKKNTIIEQINRADMMLIENDIMEKNDIEESDDFIFAHIKKRCQELIAKHPDKKSLFKNYIEKQESENDILENKIIATTMVIKKR